MYGKVEIRIVNRRNETEDTHKVVTYGTIHVRPLRKICRTITREPSDPSFLSSYVRMVPLLAIKLEIYGY